MSRLDLVVGPNGAGKSTLVELVLAKELPRNTRFVNARRGTPTKIAEFVGGLTVAAPLWPAWMPLALREMA